VRGPVVSSLDPHGPVAAEIAKLWWLLLALATAVFGVFIFFLLRALFSRPRPESPDSSRRWLVAGGIVLPTTVIAVVLGLTLATMRSIPSEADVDAIVIEITGYQWWWDVRYPDHDVTTANEIHIPVGRQILLLLRSADVIHSFWIPPLGGKLDLLPDRTNTLILRADEAGVYRGVCAEFCGLQHAKMGFVAVAEPAAEFEQWLEGQKQTAAAPIDGLTSRGLEVFLQSDCVDCHTIRGTGAGGKKGPDLTHIATRLTLAAGTFPNTPEHLADWIANPQTLKPGAEMEDIALTAADLASLVAYLETLD
jgi:cytochrome c oxidase subunit 2